MLIPLENIRVGDRIRMNEGTDSEWLQFRESFEKFGQLQAIRVANNGQGNYELIAGKRRFRAITELHATNQKIPGIPHGFIEATYGDPPPLRQRLLMEFAENNERMDFDFVEKAKFIRRFHEMMLVDMGADLWTQDLTARALNLSGASISHYLRVEQAVREDPAVAKASTLGAAVKRMKTAEKLKVRHDDAKKSDNNAHQRAEQILACDDARVWIDGIDSDSIDLINFDPPWGDNTAHKAQEAHESFDDSTEYANTLMHALLPELYRVLKNDRFCIFWHRQWASQDFGATACQYGFNLTHTRTPCVWYKPDKVSDQQRNPEKGMIDAYEVFFLLRKGDPVFHERAVHNVFSHPRVMLGQLTHPTEKPVSLCSDLLRICSVPGEIVLDPTAGSAAFLDAAIRVGRKAKGCELSPRYHERGVTRLAEYLKTFSV